MKNKFETRGPITAIFLKRKDGSTLETLIDTADLEKVSSFPNSWCASYNKDTKSYYVYGGVWNGGNETTIKMHRWIMNASDKDYVDHKNHDTLLNTRENLRLVTNSINGMNRKSAQSNSKTGVLNVHWLNQKQRYQVKFRVNGKSKHFGFFKNLDDAIKRANLVRSELNERNIC